MLASRSRTNFLAVSCWLLACSVAGAEVLHSVDHSFESERFASRGGADVTFAQIDAYLQQVPEEDRAELLASPDRLAAVLQNLFLPNLLHLRALEDNFLEQDKTLRAQLFQSNLNQLANAYLESYVAERLLEDYEQRARELWLSSPERFQTPETVDFTQIFIDSGILRGEVDAIRRVLSVYDQLLEDADLEQLAEEFSDDPNLEDNAGRYENARLNRLDEAIARALAALEPGQISEPVRSSAGWHILRLDARNPREEMDWEQARPAAIQMARSQHQSRLVEQLYRELLGSPLELAPGALPALLERYRLSDEIQVDEQSLEEAAQAPEF